MTPRLTIRTPEGVEFSMPLAGPASRLLAMVVDLLVISAIGEGAAQLFAVFQGISGDSYLALMILAEFAAWIAYGIVLEWWWNGQTLGKRLLRLRVIDAQGGRLDAAQIVIRNVVRLVDMLPAFYLVGGAAALLDGRLRRLGDIAANTVVARVDPVAPPALEALLGGRYNSMLAHRHLAARLRQRTPPRLAAAALDALLRRDAFAAEARPRVFAALAGRFRELVPFPPEAVESLADEQYVRNAVEIVFRAR